MALCPEGYWEIYDRVREMETYIHQERLENGMFSLGKWYAEFCVAEASIIGDPWVISSNWLYDKEIPHTLMGTLSEEKCIWYGFELPKPKRRITEVPKGFVQWWKTQLREYGASEVILGVSDYDLAVDDDDLDTVLVGLRALQVDRKSYAAIQRNSATVKDKTRLLPKPVVLRVKINGQLVRALVDSGSQGDFVSSTLVDQLGLKWTEFSEPLKLQLAVQGSRSVINARVEARFQYNEIDENRVFDVINLNNYDVILGTPWMYQHQVCVGLNPARILVGSKLSIPITKGTDTKPLVNAISLDPGKLDAARAELMAYADPICKEVADSDFPPLRVINHTIPLIDEHKTYPWRPSKCPEVFRSQWTEKRDAYLRSGRWEITAAGNTVPMMLIPNLPKCPSELRIVVDLRERNKNTRKMTSPMPDMEGMLRRASQHPFRSALDLKGAYEQIRVVPEHVPRTTVTTPDGNMVSHVIQQGDCNAPATYQALMNNIFSALIGRCMDVYLDDIIVYSSTLEQHMRDVKSVINILTRERLYLSKKKLRFLAPEVDLLGHLVDDDGIRMDPHKVDSVITWKMPTNRDLLRGFLGSVGYLADDVPGVRIPMGILSGLTGDTTPFRWTYMEQRAFEDVKRLVHEARDHRRRPLDYSEGAPQIWMVTDGCGSGISGVVSQGKRWQSARVAAFYSAKLNPAQQNYPVHEIEMLAGVETMLRHQDLLQGVKFKWVTDHKGLTHLLNQKNLSGRQARWLEKITIFPFEVLYVPGADNILADALSRIYSNDAVSDVWVRSEYTYHDVVDDDVEPHLGDFDGMTAVEAGAVGLRKWKEPPVPAETGRPETLKEFAMRMREGFVLRGPTERKEGGSRTRSSKRRQKPPPTQASAKQTEKWTETMSDQEEPRISPSEDRAADSTDHDDLSPIYGNLPSLPDILTASEDGIDLVQGIQNRYAEDKFFDKIL